MVLLPGLLVAFIGSVAGYSTGPPNTVCDSMAPNPIQHQSQPQTDPAPYSVLLDKTTYSPGGTVKVTLSGSPSFKGFFIQAREAKDTYITHGSFDSPSETRNPCGLNTAALCHSSPTLKSSVVITWTAPTDYTGNIVFVFTVVQSKSVYWVKLQSATLTYQAPTPGPTQAPTTQGSTAKPDTTKAATQGPTQGPTQTSSNTIDRDPACGVTLGCFPAECTTDCDYLVTWRDLGDDLEFTMHKKTARDNYYFSIGFSADPKMGDDSVQDCKSSQGSVDIISSFNHALKYNEDLTQPNYGVELLSGSYASGILSCKFRRKKNAGLVTSGANGRRRRESVGGISTFFDLEKDWYLLVAHGTVDSGYKNKHSWPPVVSQTKIDFQAVTEAQVTTPRQTTSAALKKDSRCGESVGCFHNCKGDDCDFLLTWKENGDDIDMSLSCKQSGNVYCAIGLSDDQEMGDDSVFECVSSGNLVQPYVSYNVKSGNDNERLDDGQFGLTAIKGSHIEGILRCEFSRKKTAALVKPSNGRRKRAAASASTFFDMNSDWYLLYAYGGSTGGFIFKHTALPTVSSQKADFQQFQDISAEGIDNNMIRAHGIIMVVAWAFNAAIGIFMARFYKQTWPDGMEWCGDKRWFVIHRALMISTFVLTVVGVILIFVHVEGWAEIVGSGFEKSHPIIGIVVTALVFINPIMAFFRPHPGTPKRPLFKAAHTLVGVAAYILAMVNIFSGTILTAAHMPEYIRYILYAYCGWVFLIDMCLHVYECSKRSGKKGEAYEMKQHASDDNLRDGSQGVDNMKVGFLVVNVLVVIGLVVAVAIVIGTANKDGHDH